MEHKITFNKRNPKVEIELDVENPYFKFKRIEFPSVPKRSKNVNSLIPNYDIEIITRSLDGAFKINEIRGFPHTATNEELMNVSFSLNLEVAKEINNRLVELIFSNKSESDEDVIITYTTLSNNINLKNPFNDFKYHIEQPDNIKILFSGSFGQGKTTFLNHFFKQHEDHYEVFKLYPVNYAVSHNEDIFKYIKVEILFQLMGKNVQFDKLEFSFLEAGQNYVSKNINKIISPLISLLPKIGETASKVFDKIFELKTAIEKHKKDVGIDDEDKALNYIHELYEKEGSIFEDNFYTQLIRELLEQLSEGKKKKNVLIIDDLDRMDPDHIFRIFNVFAAHFDSPERREMRQINKFGFDKIILVCDIPNIESIYSHRYGNTTSITGYLSKYYSRAPFIYDNAAAITVITDEMTLNRGRRVESRLAHFFQVIINDMISANELTLRDLIKIKKDDFYNVVNSLQRVHSQKNKTFLIYHPFFAIIKFLEQSFLLSTLAIKFERTKKNLKYSSNHKYTLLTNVALTSVFEDDITRIYQREFVLNGEKLTFKIELTSDLQTISYDYYIAADVNSSVRGSNVAFDSNDFYYVLLRVLENYKALKEVINV